MRGGRRPRRREASQALSAITATPTRGGLDYRQDLIFANVFTQDTLPLFKFTFYKFLPKV